MNLKIERGGSLNYGFKPKVAGTSVVNQCESVKIGQLLCAKKFDDRLGNFEKSEIIMQIQSHNTPQ